MNHWGQERLGHIELEGVRAMIEMMFVISNLMMSAASGALCVLAFPKFDLFFLGYVGLIPLLLSIRRARSYPDAALLGFRLRAYPFRRHPLLDHRPFQVGRQSGRTWRGRCLHLPGGLHGARRRYPFGSVQDISRILDRTDTSAVVYL